jgi:hypothetical protein
VVGVIGTGAVLVGAMVIYFVADLNGVDNGVALFVFDEATLFGSVLCAFTAKTII